MAQITMTISINTGNDGASREKVLSEFHRLTNFHADNGIDYHILWMDDDTEEHGLFSGFPNIPSTLKH